MRLQVCSATQLCFQGHGSFLSIYSTILGYMFLIPMCEIWLPQHQSSHPRSRQEGGREAPIRLVPFIRRVKPSQTLCFRNFHHYILLTRTGSWVHSELQTAWQCSCAIRFIFILSAVGEDARFGNGFWESQTIESATIFTGCLRNKRKNTREGQQNSQSNQHVRL